MTAKKTALSTFLIGHVTKDGALAGLPLLEHMVDTVLYFQGDRGHNFLVLRAVKNRFGSTNEIGVYEMKEQGLPEVANPPELFLSERPLRAPGSAVACRRRRRGRFSSSCGRLSAPLSRRAAAHRDRSRPQPGGAAGRGAGKKMGAKLFNQDMFVNVAGGVQVDEPAVDLEIVAAVASSYREKAIDAETVLLGEVGLAGEVRGIAQAEARVKEAGKLGFRRYILPESNRRQLGHIKIPELASVASLRECREMLF